MDAEQTCVPPVPPTSIPPTTWVYETIIAAEKASATTPTRPSYDSLSFPTAWLCSTCGATHSVLELLPSPPPSDDDADAPTTAIECACGQPTLQAVYDQFGSIFLYWRNDPAILDLRDPEKVREAAWRVARAGGGDGGFFCGPSDAGRPKRWSRSSSSESSVASVETLA